MDSNWAIIPVSSVACALLTKHDGSHRAGLRAGGEGVFYDTAAQILI